MSDNFEWHTEDDWDQFGQDDDSAELSSPNRKRWIITGIILLAVVLVGGYFLAQNMSQRVEEVTAFTEENVRSSYRLLERAVENNDLELFNSLLSGRDEAWTDARQLLFIERELFDRAPLGLNLIADEKAEVVAVTMSPELRSAELTAHRPFAIDVGNGVTETITLAQQFTFRRGSDNFIYAPHEEDFWGEQRTLSGERLRLSYWEIDQAFAERFYNDLDVKLIEFCTKFYNETCGRRLPINVTLSTASDSLVNIGRLETFLKDNALAITLPSPTLVGNPVNDDGYRALFAGYMEKIVTALMADLIQYRCCAHIAYFNAIVDRQMTDLGLRPSPLTSADYQAIVNLGFPLEANLEIWDITSERVVSADQARIVAATLAYFFDRDSTLTLLDLLSAMMSASGGFRSWQSNLLPADSLSDRFNQFEAVEREDWQRFIIENAQDSTIEPPLPYPDESLVVACSAESGGSLHKFNAEALAWDTLSETDDPTTFASNLPGRDAFFVYEIGENRWNLSVWIDDVAHTINAGTGQQGEVVWLYQGASDDNLILTESESFAISRSPSLSFLNWRSCAIDNQCELTPLTGLAVWSPDGEYALVVEVDQNQGNIPHTNLIDRDGNVVRQVSTTAGLQVWLDTERFALIPAAGNTLAWTISTGHIDKENTSHLLTMDDLHDALPIEFDNRVLTWTDVAPVPGNSAELLIILHDVSQARYVLLRYNTETADAHILYETPQWIQMPRGADGQRLSESISADNRFVILDENPFQGSRRLLLLDTTDDSIVDYGTASQPQWIGNWLVDAQTNYLRLVLPGHNFQQFVPLPTENCATMAWYEQ